jgi:hypothetical protein
MQARRSFGRTRALLALGLLTLIAGCLTSGSAGDPGAGFVSGGAGSSGTGYGGSGTSAAGVGGAAGTFNSCDVSPTTAGYRVGWTIEDQAGVASTCSAAGALTVDVEATRPDRNDVGSLTSKVCDIAMPLTPCARVPGVYTVSLMLRGPTGALLSEIVAPNVLLTAGEVADLGSLPFVVGGDAALAHGYALTWSIDAAATGAPLSCADANAATVRLQVGSQKFDLPCGPGRGRTTPVSPGSNPVSMTLLDVQGNALSMTQTMQVTIDAGQLVFLGDVVFDVI